MKKVSITGISGFVGKSLRLFLSLDYDLQAINRNEYRKINGDCVIHLAGKAHDLKNTSLADEYYTVNTELTKNVFDCFIASDAKVFITLSSVKAVADNIKNELLEEHSPNPITHYGLSKLYAEQYIMSKSIPKGKRVYILRPCMIHGPGNSGNLNLLYKFVSNRLPWPLGAYKNKRSFCSIDNLCFVIKELIENESIPSGIYNVSDDAPMSTIEIIELIGYTQSRKIHILNIPRSFIKILSRIGDVFNLPFNSERLHKLTQSYIVNNSKIKNAIGKALPMSSYDGFLKTFNSFNQKQ